MAMKTKIISAITAMAVAGTAFAVSADGIDKYAKDYTIQNILSDYQYFVSGDATISSHTVGGIAVGGKGNFMAWGDAQIAPTYVHEIVAYANFNGASSNWLSDDDKNNKVYYGICENPTSDMTQNDEFIDFTEAMGKIQYQSELMAANAVTIPESEANLDHEPWESCTLTIDVSKYSTSDFVVSYELLDKVSHINFIDSTNPSFSIENLARDGYTISVTGVGNKDLEFFFGWTNSSTGLQINGETLNNNNSFKNLEGTEQGGQLFTKGMNLVWNFPDATGIISNDYLAGHMIAPKATVMNTGGNFEGGIIAKNVVSRGEGHFFPFFEPKITNSYEDVFDDVSDDSSETDSSSVADSSSEAESSSSIADSSSEAESSSSIADSSSEAESSSSVTDSSSEAESSSSIADSSSEAESSSSVTDSSSEAESSSSIADSSSEAESSSSVADSSSEAESSSSVADSSSEAESSSSIADSSSEAESSSSIADSSSEAESSSSVADSSSEDESGADDSTVIDDNNSSSSSSSEDSSSSSTSSDESSEDSSSSSSSSEVDSEVDDSTNVDDNSGASSSEVDDSSSSSSEVDDSSSSSSEVDDSSSSSSSEVDDSSSSSSSKADDSNSSSSSSSNSSSSNANSKTDNANNNKKNSSAAQNGASLASPNTGAGRGTSLMFAVLLTGAAAFCIGKKKK